MESITEADSESSFFVGVDVGGTSIKVGLASGCGEIIYQYSIPTNQDKGPEDAVARISESLHQNLSDRYEDIKGIGLGTPGPLCTRTGMILDPVNLPGWLNFPIRQRLSEALDRPVVYTNDGNAAAFGEYWIGTGRHYHSLVLMTLGTGVGSGIICDDFLIDGATDHAAECGHLTIDFAESARVCSCGKKGHLEAYSSATAVAKRAKQLAEQHPSCQLAEQQKMNGSLFAADVYHCAATGDDVANSLIDETAMYLARGITAIVHTVEPEIVLLGGAMNFGGPESPVGRRFLSRIDAAVRESVFSKVAESLKIEFASLGGSAGWIGAAGLSKRDYDRKV